MTSSSYNANSAEVLQGLTRLAILGDFTRAGEGVAVDDVSVLFLLCLTRVRANRAPVIDSCDASVPDAACASKAQPA